MADGEIVFETKLNDTDFSQKLSKVGKVFNDLEKNVKKSSTKQNEALNSTAKAASSLKEKLENAAKAFSSSSTIKNLKEIGASISTLFQTATGVIGAVTGEIMAMADAANTQSDAETKLALAAKNNPYLDDYSVQKLKEYAGELQGVSEVGDEVLLPMMAKSDSKKMHN